MFDKKNKQSVKRRTWGFQEVSLKMAGGINEKFILVLKAYIHLGPRDHSFH